MLKSNTAKEVLYIFLWLIGISLFYTLVYTFILEPSDEKSKNTHEKHAIKSTITHSNKTISSHKNTHTKISIEKVPTPIKVEPSTAHKVVKSHPVTKHDVKVPSAQKVVHIITKPQS
ncbi:MAG TPA: hypothetical protein EYG82_02320, partial [Sulfurovum sp.]|nr:hypothetical protein [Sulfurovum sp.]